MAQTAGGALRRGSDRIVAGVCSGLAHYFGVDPIIVRLIFVLVTLFHGVGILIYIVLWVVMEPPANVGDSNRTLSQRLRTMGDEIRDDFRHGFSRSEAAAPSPAPSGPSNEPPAGTPPSYPPTQRRGLWFGGILIVLGAYLLLDNLGLFSGFQWGIFWPVVIILIGVFFLVRRR